MTRKELEFEKELVANHAVKFVKNGMKVGLGSGSTSLHMIRKLGEEVQRGLLITAVASSDYSARLARSVGIPLTTLELAGQLDLNIDGTDEFDTKYRLIKGGGGALLHEKILAANAKYNIIITDSTKQVNRLGAYKLPLETVRFATANIMDLLQHMELSPRLRMVGEKPFITDEDNYIIDIDISEIRNVENINMELIQIPGVVETGLFLKSTNLIVMARGNEVVQFDVKSTVANSK